jgi:hypothetical protein
MASCTRFSPNRVCPPSAMVGQTSSAEKVFETATSLTSSGALSQSRARRAIASRNAASRSVAPNGSSGWARSIKIASFTVRAAACQKSGPCTT